VRPLYLARRVLEQERRQRGRKVYSLHAPEVECIWQGQGTPALRVRRQGERRHPREAFRRLEEEGATLTAH